MRHDVDAESLGPPGEAMAQAVTACVHCGFCLAACPTYRITGAEAHSPRGRIVLMKEVLEGSLAAEEARPFVDACLGCQACEPACPSGVGYGALLHPYRDLTRAAGRGPFERLVRFLVHHTVPHPGRFRLALRLQRLIAPVAGWLPRRLRPLAELAPRASKAPATRPGTFPASGPRRGRVALLRGCAQQVLAPEIEHATLGLLNHQGVEVVVPAEQGCCGALALHDGEWPLARRLARRNLGVLAPEGLGGPIDAVVSNAAGCGSGLRELGDLFAGEPEEAMARELARRVVDVATYLDDLGLVVPASTAKPRRLRLAYQDACHLAQAQGVKGAPRRLLSAIPGVELVAVGEEDLCCGSAGTYNLFQPEMARRLAERKVDQLVATGADGVATGNVGCLVQLRAAIERRGLDLPIRHTVEWLRDGISSQSEVGVDLGRGRPS